MTDSDNNSDNLDMSGPNLENSDVEQPIKTITVNIMSFGHVNGKPEIVEADLLYSIKNFANVKKKIRDVYDGTAYELQRSLLDNVSNKEKYDEIIKEIKDRIISIKDSEKAHLNVYIGCHAGHHRSVAVASLLVVDLKPLLKDHLAKYDVQFSLEHRDLDPDKALEFGKNKKATQNRMKRRDAKNLIMNDDY
jgi:RNase adaptor protein for sRNA GlmZ degradation